VKLLLDECLSHFWVGRLAARGYPDVLHPIHVGLRGVRDDTIVAHAATQDRVIVTSNGRDFVKLLGRADVHPGLIILEALDFESTWTQLLAALAFIERQSSPSDWIVNRVVEVTTEGVRSWDLPPTGS
jgi:predicted nuclease of predicted toxin-antitoxin system